MDRMTCKITDDNRCRLEMLKAFAVSADGCLTLQDIVNLSIEGFFVSVYARYSVQRVQDESLKERMEELLPQECRGSRGRLQIRPHRMIERCRSSRRSNAVSTVTGSRTFPRRRGRPSLR